LATGVSKQDFSANHRLPSRNTPCVPRLLLLVTVDVAAHESEQCRSAATTLIAGHCAGLDQLHYATGIGGEV